MNFSCLKIIVWSQNECLFLKLESFYSPAAISVFVMVSIGRDPRAGASVLPVSLCGLRQKELHGDKLTDGLFCSRIEHNISVSEAWAHYVSNSLMRRHGCLPILRQGFPQYWWRFRLDLRSWTSTLRVSLLHSDHGKPWSVSWNYAFRFSYALHSIINLVE